MIRRILLLGEPSLYEVSDSITPDDEPQLDEWIQDLHDTLFDFRRTYGAGRAIAAPQIGIRKRLLYMHIGEPTVFINPVLVPQSNDRFDVWDDCMSFPNLRVLVERYRHCRIDYLDRNFQPQSLELTDDLSELLQHEYDHLDGVLATMRAKSDSSFRMEFATPKRTTRRIGLLGGISYASTIEYYRRLMTLYYEQNQDLYYPEIVIHSLNFQRFTDLENHDHVKYVEYIAESLTLLKQSAVDFALMAANSPHSVFDKVNAMGIVPLVSLVDAVAEEAQRRGLKKLLLLGIRYTMDHTFYQDALLHRGMELITPNDAEKSGVEAIIFGELARERFQPESKQWLIELIQRYSVDGVILGCTELPLIIQPEDVDIEVLNTIDIHCRAVMAKLQKPTQE